MPRKILKDEQGTFASCYTCYHYHQKNCGFLRVNPNFGRHTKHNCHDYKINEVAVNEVRKVGIYND